jgi:hypothetical protein
MGVLENPLFHNPQLDKAPAAPHQPVTQKEQLAPDILGPPHPVATLKLHVASTLLYLPGSPNDDVDLLSRSDEVGQKGRSLRRPQSHRRIGARELDQYPGAAGDKGGRVMGEPGAPGLFRRAVEVAFLSARGSGN